MQCRRYQVSSCYSAFSSSRKRLDGRSKFLWHHGILLKLWLNQHLQHHFRLFAQDRPDEAKEILVKYHGDGNPNSPIVALEMTEMRQIVSSTGSDKRFWDFRDLFNSPGARYRTLLVVCVAWFSEIELPPTSYYLPLMGTRYILSLSECVSSSHPFLVLSLCPMQLTYNFEISQDRGNHEH